MRGYTDSELNTVYAMWQDGYKWKAIAAQFGWERGKTKHAIRAARRQYASAPACEGHDQGAGGTVNGGVSHESAAGASFTVDSYVYNGTMPAGAVPRFTGAWHLHGDFMVINDVHIPATNWALAERMLSIATTHLPHPRKLIIAGDLLNGDAMSHYDDIVLCTPLADEITYANAFLNHLARWFEEIYFFRGNHDARLLYGMRGQLHAPMFMRMITDNQRVKFSIYPYMRVTSGGREWHITHQRNYSQKPLTVARKLATKHAANIICTHQHHSAIGRDEGNRFACVDSGGLHDSDLMAYVKLEDSTSPVMCNGFVLLKDGIGTLFTPEEYALTDWARWDAGTREGAMAA